MNRPTAQQQQTSKLLSLLLRHQPEKFGLSLAADGWIDLDQLIAAARSHGHDWSRQLIEAVVADSDKQRFAISPDGLRIRANQGHSVAVELGLPAVVPPAVLYHGTAQRFVAAILQEGLQPMGRQHVHLSATTETALKVGQRHGKPVILEVDCQRLHASGRLFWCADNGVWLSEAIAPEYLRQLPQE